VFSKKRKSGATDFCFDQSKQDFDALDGVKKTRVDGRSSWDGLNPMIKSVMEKYDPDGTLTREEMRKMILEQRERVKLAGMLLADSVLGRRCPTVEVEGVEEASGTLSSLCSPSYLSSSALLGVSTIGDGSIAAPCSDVGVGGMDFSFGIDGGGVGQDFLSLPAPLSPSFWMMDAAPVLGS